MTLKQYKTLTGTYLYSHNEGRHGEDFREVQIHTRSNDADPNNRIYLVIITDGFRYLDQCHVKGSNNAKEAALKLLKSIS
jgi:hypothetical protein